MNATNANREIALAVSNAQRASELVPYRTLSRPFGAASADTAARGVVGRIYFLRATYSDRPSNLLMYLGCKIAPNGDPSQH
jgi:hypothetical protein